MPIRENSDLTALRPLAASFFTKDIAADFRKAVVQRCALYTHATIYIPVSAGRRQGSKNYWIFHIEERLIGWFTSWYKCIGNAQIRRVS